jgi:hypothetical protein
VPSSRPERVLALGGVLLAAALAILVGVAWAQYRDAEPPTLRVAPAEGLSEAPAVSVPDFVPLPTTREVASSPADDVARLAVVASRGPCWLEVRRGGSAGPVSFVGLLAQGDGRTFRGKMLWLTVGAGQNVDLRLNGEPVSNVPAGVSTLTARPSGVAASTPG